MDVDQLHLTELSMSHPEIAKHIFSFLDIEHFAKAHEVCQAWAELVDPEDVWKARCINNWKSLQTDENLWRFIAHDIAPDSRTRWRQMYPLVRDLSPWIAHLQKNGKFVCSMTVHPMPDDSFLGDYEPGGLKIVDTQYQFVHLPTFVVPRNVAVHFEAETEGDRAGFDDFVRYLRGKVRGDVPTSRERTFIAIPREKCSCSFIQFHGESLFGFVARVPLEEHTPPIEEYTPTTECSCLLQ